MTYLRLNTEERLLSFWFALNLSDDRVLLIFCGISNGFSEVSEFSPITDTELVKLTVLRIGFSPSSSPSFFSRISSIRFTDLLLGDLLGELFSSLPLCSFWLILDPASLREYTERVLSSADTF